MTNLFVTLLERREVAAANSTRPQYCPEFPGECSIIVKTYNHYGNKYIYVSSVPFLIYFYDNVLQLVGGGSVIKGAYPV